VGNLLSEANVHHLPMLKSRVFCRINSEEVRLMLWDTAGQEEFDAITKAYYRGAQACVVAFSTTDRASFDGVRKWKKKVEDECGHVPMVLVQNKIDLMHEAQVST
jgi:Ras-related protein Rab-23